MDEIRPVLRIFELENRKNKRNCIFGNLGSWGIEGDFSIKNRHEFCFFLWPIDSRTTNDKDTESQEKLQKFRKPFIFSKLTC